MIELKSVEYPTAETQGKCFQVLVQDYTQSSQASETSKQAYKKAMQIQEANNFWSLHISDSQPATINKNKYLLENFFPIPKLASDVKTKLKRNRDDRTKHRLAQALERMLHNVAVRIVSFIDCMIQTESNLANGFNHITPGSATAQVGIAYQKNSNLQHYQLRLKNQTFNIERDSGDSFKLHYQENNNNYYYQGDLSNDDANARVEVKAGEQNFDRDLESGSRDFRPQAFERDTIGTPKNITIELQKNWNEFLEEVLSIDDEPLVANLNDDLGKTAQVNGKPVKGNVISEAGLSVFDLVDFNSLIKANTNDTTESQAGPKDIQQSIQTKALFLIRLLELIKKRNGQLKETEIVLRDKDIFQFNIPISENEFVSLDYRLSVGKRKYTLTHNHIKPQKQYRLYIERDDNDKPEEGNVLVVDFYKENSNAQARTRYQGSLETGEQGNLSIFDNCTTVKRKLEF